MDSAAGRKASEGERVSLALLVFVWRSMLRPRSIGGPMRDGHLVHASFSALMLPLSYFFLPHVSRRVVTRPEREVA